MAEIARNPVDQGQGIQDCVARILRLLGEDPTREGLKETPARTARAFQEWFGGYNVNPEDLFRLFVDGAENYKFDEMVVQTNIPVYSHCEHHMAPILGTCSIGYIPDGKILGLSKMVRIVDIFARRLQVQERLTQQIADVFATSALRPKGVGVIIKARHLCMESRGVRVQGAITTTSALRGNLLLNPTARAEFLELVREGL